MTMSALNAARSHRARPYPGWRLWLCAAMLFVQTLALVHGVSHGLPAFRQGVPEQAQGQVGPRLADQEGQGAGAVQGLEPFAGHQDSYKCRLLDHLAEQGAPVLVIAGIDAARPSPVRADVQNEPIATRLIAAFQARGPPTHT